jgi:hypothetical protein
LELEGKAALEKEEKFVLRKLVTKWTNCCGAVGKWTSADLENGWIEDQPRLSQGESGKT